MQAALSGSTPPVGDPSQMQNVMMHQQQNMVAQFTRQAAEQYDQAKQSNVDPEITEMAHYFGLDDRAVKLLDQQMRNRRDTFEQDMSALWEILEGARNPSGLLMVKVREMAEGTYRGFTTPEKDVAEFAKKHNLDMQASAKLAEVLERRDDPKEDMRKIAMHLERSNKPSALMMLMLKDLRAGKNVKEPEHQAAIGSKVHERELKKDEGSKKDRGYRRSRDRGAGGDGTRQRERSRERSRERRRSRSRDRRDRRSRSRRSRRR